MSPLWSLSGEERTLFNGLHAYALFAGDALLPRRSFRRLVINPDFAMRRFYLCSFANLQFALARNVLATGATSNHLINGLGFIPV
jgi:hypothetical protein